VGDDYGPEEECEERWGDYCALYPKENAQLRDWHERQEALDEPVEEEAQKASGGDSRIRREMIREIDKAWPDRI
jgi:hypothetical protein